ncbi:MAG: DNA translocase FtsK [Firmicutes bacterium]|nr:DNA translocase FtsK [Bacillota bacterium]
MAKKKKRKQEQEEKKFQLPIEVHGIIYIILAILGFGPGKPLGLIGRLVRSFSTFLFGTWDVIFILILLVLGIYLILKKQYPSFFDKRLIGFYILLIGILVYSHLKYIELNDGNSIIFQESWNDIMSVINTIMNKSEFTTIGGGMIGCCLAILFKILFDYQGTQIISIILMILGVCLFTGISIFDYLRKGVDKGKEIISKDKAKQDETEEVEYDSETGEVKDSKSEDKEEVVDLNERTVITSIDELNETAKLRIEELEKKKELKEKANAQKENTDNNQKLPEINFNTNLPPKSDYKLPTLDLLKKTKQKNNFNEEAIRATGDLLVTVLSEFGIEGASIVDIHVGPSVTQYELSIKTGTKLSRILSINKEISLALAKKDVRIQAPIPGKRTVGVEVANDSIQPVGFREVLEKAPLNKANSKLLVALGKNIMGETKFAEIDKTPHLLVAGATGSGKSVCINCIIASILMRTKPDEVKLVMVDPKKVELSNYNGVPHLLMPVVTDPKKASVALQKIVHEMELRYDEFEAKKVKNIATYNAWVDKENENRVDTDRIRRMPYIVVIVDELADLMLVASKEVEDSIMRITQMARAAGIHLIVATQRPSTDVITGVVKANIPSRLSFAVSSSIDSRTILDMTGAEKLLGKGDMLFLPMGENAPERIQGAYVSDEELENIINWTINQQKAQYDENFLNLQAAAEEQGNAGGHPKDVEEEYDDPLYNDIVDFVIETQKASASLLQRRFKVGYNRAARIIDLLEERGIIGPQNGSKPREVLIKQDASSNDEDPIDEE